MYDGSCQHALLTHKFTGKERDTESGLDNFGARYDASSLGRFMTADPVPWVHWQNSSKKDMRQFAAYISNPLNFNMYAYVRNNPLNSIDPTGELVYVVAYTTGNSEGDEELKKAAQTKANEIMTYLANMQPPHIRMQVLDIYIPQTGPTTWDFSNLDGMVQQIMSVGDHSPEFQIAMAPAFMYDSTGTNFLDPTYQTFATYCKHLAEYYSNGQFTDEQGVLHQNPNFDPAHPLLWWGIYNEPNGIGALASDQYVKLYNVVVPAMQSVNPNLKFAAVELADFPDSWEPWLTGLDAAHDYLPTFVSNVNAQVDVLANHFYSTWIQTDSDQTLFDTIPWIAQNTRDIPSILAANPNLANVPIWMTENNVNANWDNGTGNFVLDHRGSSAFFAAWRPTMFSQLGQAGEGGLYHWTFIGDAQYGEINGQTGNIQLGYWVDYWLGRMFPSPPGENILALNLTQSATVEILATKRDDGSVVIMVANHAVHAHSDNNGNGDPRTVVLDVSSLGNLGSASQLTIDARTNPMNGPVSASLTPASRFTVSLDGYGVSFLTLKP
jgi:RHS repeat-associated protein